ncbi:MAG: RNA polymerase sigma factor [Phycisphaerae bacterium]
MIPEQIIAACRRGDREAQRALYAATADRVYRLLLRMTRNSEDAADLLQETYLRVFRNIGQFEATSSPYTWIYRIAVNEAQQWFRRRGRQERLLVSHARETRDVQISDHPDVHSWEVQEAVASLPDAERDLIVLRYFDGLSYTEMAQVLEKPVGTIASGLNRARSLLQGILAAEVQDRP